jgi:hypothetical protein
MKMPTRKHVLAAVLSFAAVLAGFSIVVRGPASPVTAAAATTTSRLAFHDASRKLWEDHTTWTRCFIVSAGTLPTDLPDRGATTDRLLENQVDLGNVIRTYYGNKAGDDVTALLRQHILLAAQIIDAAKAGDTATQQEALDAWYGNANQIATYLHRLNPQNWSVADLKALLKKHLDLTLAEAVDRLGGQYAQDVSDYDAVHAEILQLADAFSAGIIAQFPDRFGGQ